MKLVGKAPEKRFVAILRQQSAGLTAHELAELCNLTVNTVNYHLRKCHAYPTEHPHRVRISGWVRYSVAGQWAPMWMLDPVRGDRQRPKPKTRAELAKGFRARHKAMLGVTERGAAFRLAQGGTNGIWGPLTQLSKAQP